MADAAEGQNRMTEEEGEALVERARQLLYGGSLAEVAANRNTIGALVEGAAKALGYGGIPDDVWDMLTMLDDLVAGKVDRIAMKIKLTLPAHLEALQAMHSLQVQRLELEAARLTKLLKEAIEVSGKPLVGMTWQATIQANSQPSVVVQEVAKIPPKLRKRRASIKFDFPVDAKIEKEVQALIARWGGDKAKVAGIEGFKGVVEDWVPAAGIVADMKASKEGLPCPGVFVELGSHVRIKPSGAKAAPSPSPLKLAAPLSPEQEGAL